MPKAFDSRDRIAIRAALMEKGMEQFARTGVRAARVDDICRAVGIAKGSFYAFFPSKEELFMAIADAREERHKADMLAFAGGAAGSPRDRAGAFFDMLAGKIASDPLLAIVTSHGEIAHLVRKLGPERMAKGERDDIAFVEDVAARWPGGLDAMALLGLMTLMLTFITSRTAMSEGQYQPTLALLRELFVEKLVGAPR